MYPFPVKVYILSSLIGKSDEAQEQIYYIKKHLGVCERTATALKEYGNIEELDSETQAYDNVKKYFYHSRSDIHFKNSLYSRLKLKTIYKVKRRKELKNKKYKRDYRMLLWHGTRKTNFLNIMKNGLGTDDAKGMLGRGLYFADRSTKAAQYCFDDIKIHGGRKCLFLCDVAVGNIYQINHGPYDRYKEIHKAPDNCNSVKVVGKYIPDPSGSHNSPHGYNYPMGDTIRNGNWRESDLRHNEYCVYNKSRVKLKYIIAFEAE